MFFIKTMVEDIFISTNKRIEQTIAVVGEERLASNKYFHVKLVNTTDNLSLFGLMYMRGFYGINKHTIDLLFLHRKRIPIFSATISRSRYKFIIKHKCFDDFESRNEKWKHDRFAAMHSLFEQCNRKFGEALVPKDYISLEERLYPMRNQVSFKQYNPEKPAKYGILLKSLNSSRYAYTYQTL